MCCKMQLLFWNFTACTFCVILLDIISPKLTRRNKDTLLSLGRYCHHLWMMQVDIWPWSHTCRGHMVPISHHACKWVNFRCHAILQLDLRWPICDLRLVEIHQNMLEIRPNVNLFLTDSSRQQQEWKSNCYVSFLLRQETQKP